MAMRRSIKTGLALLASGAALLLVDDGARVRSRRVLASARKRLSRKPIVDQELTHEVRAKLEQSTAHANAIRVEVDHACVVLAGHVVTDERARLVRAVSRVAGVDSVVDLMTEHPSAADFPPVSQAPTSLRVRSEWPRRARGRVRAIGRYVRDLSVPVRIIAGGAGLGLAAAGMKIRGLVGIPLGVVGVVLMARAMTPARRVVRALPPAPRAALPARLQHAHSA